MASYAIPIVFLPVSSFFYFIILITASEINRPFGIFLSLIVLWWLYSWFTDKN